MASSALAEPGTEFGPCKDKNCGHKDCVELRRMAASVCRICGKNIGYERHYYQEKDWTVLVHSTCLEEEIEAERKAR